MTIKEIHDFILLLLNKHNTGYAAPAEIDSALDRAQMWYFNRLYGNIEEYQPGRPVPRVAYGSTTAIHDHLAPFKATSTSSSNSSGSISLPSDYMHVIAIRKNNISVPLISEDELGIRLDSYLFEPTSTEPVSVISGKGTLQLHPKETHNTMEVDYLKRPTKPVFGFTQSGRTITYNSGTSTQMDWNEPALNAIMMRALQYLGVNLEDGLIVQYTEGKIQQGS